MAVRERMRRWIRKPFRDPVDTAEREQPSKTRHSPNHSANGSRMRRSRPSWRRGCPPTTSPRRPFSRRPRRIVSGPCQVRCTRAPGRPRTPTPSAPMCPAPISDRTRVLVPHQPGRAPSDTCRPGVAACRHRAHGKSGILRRPSLLGPRSGIAPRIAVAPEPACPPSFHRLRERTTKDALQACGCRNDTTAKGGLRHGSSDDRHICRVGAVPVVVPT